MKILKTLSAFFILSLIVVQCFGAGAKRQLVTVKTSFGKILFVLYDETPIHRDNFVLLAKSKFFNGTTFHRCIKNFVIQGGDPNSKDKDTANDGDGGPPFIGTPNTFKDPEGGKSYTIQAEIIPGFKHHYGAIGAARSGDNINPLKLSSGSQFYISTRKGGLPHLDKKYTVFGFVVKGMDIAELIADQPKNKNDRPLKSIKMKVKIKQVDDDFLKAKYGYVYGEEQKM